MNTVSHARSFKSALCALSLALGFCGAASADAIKVSMTVDNSYALFVGSYASATNFVGSNFDWTSTETYNFNLANSAYLYVVTASDRAVAQGFLGQFENLTAGYKFYSNDPQWQVMATNLGTSAPYSGSVSDLTLLTNEIGLANAGNVPSGGWTNFTAGGANGASPWGLRPGIDAAAHWVWYAGGDCSHSDPTIGGCNADEWLVFRIAVAATPTDPNPTIPEPQSLALVGFGLAAAGAASIYRRRRGAAA